MFKSEKIKKMLKQHVFIIMVGTLLSKFLGLIRDIVLAKYYGATLLTDSYIIATLVPSILIGVLAEAILSTYIPVLNDEETQEKKQRFTNNFVNICVIVVTAIIGIYFIFSRQIVSLFVIGFTGENLDIIVNMTNITIFASYALVLISIYSGYLQNKNKFVATSFYGVIFNLISILGICISYENYKMMAAMFTAGYGLSLLVLIVACVKYGYKYSFNCNFKDEAIKKVFFLTLPVLFNSIVWDVNVVIDKSLISTVGTGYVSALNYSYKVINVATNVIATSIAVSIFPKLSKLFVEKEEKAVNKTVNNSLSLMLTFITPITVFMICFAELIIKVLFMRGNFDENALQITRISLQIYALSIIPIGINTVLYKVFNAMKKNRIPAINAIISVIVNIIFNLLLVKIFSYKGIIIATAVSNIFASILIIMKASKNNVKIEYKKMITYLIKIGIATILSTIVAMYINKLLVINEFIKIIIIGITYCTIYLIALFIQRIKLSDIKI